MDISARPIAAICCWPPESERGRAPAMLGEHREQFVDAGERPGTGTSAVGAEQEVLLDREAREQPAPFRHHGDAPPHDLMRGASADRLAVEYHHVVAAWQRARDRAQECGLAGAVGADDGDGLALLDGDVDIEKRLEIAVERPQRTGSATGSCGRNSHIDFFDPRIRHHRAGSAFREFLAEIHHDQPARDRDQRMHDVLDPNDGGAARVDRPDGPDQLMAFRARSGRRRSRRAAAAWD